jgi:hypothetical protein
MIDKRDEFLKVLFDVDDQVAFGLDDKSACKPIDPYPEFLTTNANKFCINPLREWRNTDNVTKITALLFEMDKDEDGNIIDPKEQVKMFLESGIPYTTLVFSGTKSVHAIVRFEEPIEQEWFRSWWRAINRVLVNKGLPIDPATMKIPQLSRVPNSIRESNGERQKLIHINRRVTQTEVKAWIEANGEIVEEPYVAPIRTYEPNANALVADKELFEAAYNMHKKHNDDYNSAAESGNWNWLFSFGGMLYKVDLDLNAGVSIFRTLFSNVAHGSAGDFDVEEALSKGWKWAQSTNVDKIEVKTKQQYKKEQFDKRREDMGIDMSKLMAELDDAPKTFDENIKNYCWIGPDIFLEYPDGKLVKYSAQGFNARFKQQHLHANDIERKYSGTGYYPDYFGNNQIENNKYNTFRKPNAEIKEGDWSMTKILLQHIFGEQYELGLEYYWVKRHRPTQALPALGLVGGEDSGKSTIGKHQQFVFGNSTKIYMERLEKDENAFAIGVQDIIIEESNSKGSTKHANPMLVVNKIKDMVTSTGGKIPTKVLFDNAGESDYFAKIMLFSNDTTPLQMDGEATRFWICSIGKPEKHVGFEKKLEQEVGAFLYYLDSQFEPSRTESNQRLWFHPDEYFTVAKAVAKDASGGKLYNAIKDVLLDFFDDYPDETHCYFDQTSMKNAVCDNDYDNCTNGMIKECIMDKFKLGPPAHNRKDKADHLSGAPIKNGSWTKRKMRYWAINRDFKVHQEVEGMEDLDNAFDV